MAEKNWTPDPPPDCPNGHDAANVYAVDTGPLLPGVQYWRCRTCGKIWGTLYGKPIK
jgi:hypothetical protein